MSQAGCPICQKPSAASYRPFCSRRCADIDLQRWLTGRYALGADANSDDETEPDGRSALDEDDES
jgi:endogenous inhibitor of DNA gyrase (YacG/DUF329 family)